MNDADQRQTGQEVLVSTWSSLILFFFSVRKLWWTVWASAQCWKAAGNSPRWLSTRSTSQSLSLSTWGERPQSCRSMQSHFSLISSQHSLHLHCRSVSHMRRELSEQMGARPQSHRSLQSPFRLMSSQTGLNLYRHYWAVINMHRELWDA